MSLLSEAIDEIQLEAQRDTDANSAVLTLLVSLQAQLEEALANGTPPEQVARIKEITAAWKARNDEMVAAALADTPADPNA